MKKWVIIMLVVAVAAAAVICTAVVSAGHADKLAEARRFEEENEMTFTDRFREYATEEQWEELRNAPKSDILGQRDMCERMVREILGDIPKDSPRITLKQAKEICAKHDIADYNDNIWTSQYKLIEKFEKYAVADFNGGSGISWAIFFLDDEPTGYIDIHPLKVTYYDLVNGTQEILWEVEG